MTDSSSPPRTPFDWLSGGLSFFNKLASDESSIENTKDVKNLLREMSKNLDALLLTSTSSADAESSEPGVGTGSAAVDAAAATTTSTGDNILDENRDPSKLLARRLARLRFLLFDERRATSLEMTTNSTSCSPGNPLMMSTGVVGVGGHRRGGTVAIVMANQCLQGIVTENPTLMIRLLEHLVRLPFESRKHVAAIFNYLLVCGLDGDDAASYTDIMDRFVEFVRDRLAEIMTIVMHAHDAVSRGAPPDVGLHFGAIYRSIIRHPILYQQIVGTTEAVTQYVHPFLDAYVHVPNFEISSDAMETLRAIFAANGDYRVVVVADDATNSNNSESANVTSSVAQIAADFMLRDYEAIWDERFNPKLLSNDANYMTRRVALQILSTVLLTRSNYNVMIRYVTSRNNLITIMTLLRDTSPHITLDAFHVFKVFVANPNKPPEIVKILADNQVKLCRYLRTLHQEKEESDIQFRDEKALIIATIDAL